MLVCAPPAGPPLSSLVLRRASDCAGEPLWNDQRMSPHHGECFGCTEPVAVTTWVELAHQHAAHRDESPPPSEEADNRLRPCNMGHSEAPHEWTPEQQEAIEVAVKLAIDLPRPCDYVCSVRATPCSAVVAFCWLLPCFQSVRVCCRSLIAGSTSLLCMLRDRQLGVTSVSHNSCHRCSQGHFLH